MSDFNFIYGDEKVSRKEIFMLVPSILVGVGIITLPRTILLTTKFSDAWISIVLGAMIAMFVSYLIIKLMMRFPNQTFLEYSSKIIPKPLAALLTVFFVVYFLLFTSYEARSIATISKQYLLERTPVEVVSLVFLWLVAYAAAGSRAAILRLNMMFFPIVLLVLLLILVFNFPYVDLQHLKPFFQAKWTDVLKGTYQATFSFLGFEVLLFYMALLRKKEGKNVGRLPVIGIFIVMVIYLLILFFCITVFTVEGTRNILYPTVELAKEVEVPGGIIERVDPLFFTIWIMTIFNTTIMAFDVAVHALQSLFKTNKKIKIILCFLPIVYFISMVPQNVTQLGALGDLLGMVGIGLGMACPALLYLIACIRGVSDK